MRTLLAICLLSLVTVMPSAPIGGNLSPAALAAARRNPGGTSSVVIFLTNQPGYAVSQSVRRMYGPDIAHMGWRLRQLSRGNRPAGAIRPEDEGRDPSPLLPADQSERQIFLSEIDRLQTAQNNEIARRIGSLVATDFSQTDAYIRSRGGRVNGVVTLVPAMFATIPNSRLIEIARYARIAWVDIDRSGHPELDQHKTSLGLVGGFWANGLSGGTLDVGVLDTGVYQAHPAFAGHRFESNFGTTDPDGHGSGMAGILASGDATYTGMAFGCDTICVAQAGFETTSMAGMNYLVTMTAEKPEVINYSFGNGRANDVDYSAFDQFFDGAISTFNVMVSKSTGNNGFGTTTITHPAPAFNLMASANMDDRNTATRNDDIIYGTSSRGPTLAGRKKPDITAPGNDTMTTRNFGSGFVNLGGTSSASPHTGGGFLLVRQLGATTTYGGKAVLLNAADAWDDNNTQLTGDDGPVVGSKWNRTFGWGYLDLGEAHSNGADLFEDEIAAPVGGIRRFKLYKGSMFTGEKATLVWNRHVLFNGTQNPNQIEGLSNLDLVAYGQSNSGNLGQSVSAIDNVEQIDVDADTAVVLKVHTTGSFDPQVLTEGYGIATEEDFVAADGPAFSMQATLPGNAVPGSTVPVSVLVTNSGDLPAHNVNVTLSGAKIASGNNPQAIAFLGAGESAQASWEIIAQNSPGQQSLTFEAQSISYGELFEATIQESLIVGPLLPPISHQIVRGSVVSGVFSNVFQSDNQYFSFRPGAVFTTNDSAVLVQFGATSGTSNPRSVFFVVESAGSTNNLQQGVEMFNFVTGQWVLARTDLLGLSDATHSASAPGPPSHFVEPNTNAVLARVGSRSTGAVFTFPWHYRIDLVGWSID